MAEIILAEGNSPPTPAPGKVSIYPKTDSILYIKDDTGTETPLVASYSNEQAQDAVGGILVDSSTMDFTYNDATPSITGDVVTNSSIQKVQISKNSAGVVGARKEINFIEGSTVTLTVVEDVGNDRMNVTIDAAAGSGLTQEQVLNRTAFRA